MRRGAFVAIALISSAPGCGECDERLVCPDGWVGGGFDPCVATAAYVDDVAAGIDGGGAYGFVYTITGNCALDACGCIHRTAPLVDMTVYLAADVLDYDYLGDCGFQLAPGAEPVTTTTADDQGRFVIPLPDGEYALTGDDPTASCNFYGGEVTVTATRRLAQSVIQLYRAAQD